MDEKRSARNPSPEEWAFGCKAHAAADANYDLPLQMAVTTASRSTDLGLAGGLRRAVIRQRRIPGGSFALGEIRLNH